MVVGDLERPDAQLANRRLLVLMPPQPVLARVIQVLTLQMGSRLLGGQLLVLRQMIIKS